MSVCCTYTMERESTDFVPLEVVDTITGLPLTDYQTAVVKARARPTVWTPSVTASNGTTGVVLTGLTKGSWTVFVRTVFSPFEDIVTEAGMVDVT